MMSASTFGAPRRRWSQLALSVPILTLGVLAGCDESPTASDGIAFDAHADGGIVDAAPDGGSGDLAELGDEASLGDSGDDGDAEDGFGDASMDVAAEVPDGACVPTRDYWETAVWDAFMGKKCVNCHAGDGLASATEFILQGGDSPQALDVNYTASRKAALLLNGGRRLLLDKPTAQLPHGGGKQIGFGSPEHLALIEFVDRVLQPVSCDP